MVRHLHAAVNGVTLVCSSQLDIVVSVMDIKTRRHAVKEIKNISGKNFKKAEQMNKLEAAKMNKTLDVIDKSTR